MDKFVKKILIDLDGVLNQYDKNKYNENDIPKLSILNHIGKINF